MTKKLEKKYFGKFRESLVDLPSMVESQVASYKWFVENGVKEILNEFNPIKDYSEKKFELEFKGFEMGKPEYDEFHAKDNKLSYTAPLSVKVKLTNKTFNTQKEQDIFLVDFPVMTNHGTFVINGVERVVVPQLARSFGIFFTAQEVKGKKQFGAKIIPQRGAWIELESDIDGVIYVRIDRKRKFPISSLLRIMGVKDITTLFKEEELKKVIEVSAKKDPSKTADDSYVEIYRRLRDGGMVAPAHAKEFVDSLFEEEKYDLSEVGRFHFNQRFGNSTDKKSLAHRVITLDDLKIIIANIVKLNSDPDAKEDDIDHLGSRRVRYFGEMIQAKFRVGMLQMKRNIQDRMSIIDTEATLPAQFISPRPLQARIKEFYTTNQLSQFMQQDNILHELEHLRTVSALGTGGLVRERASFEVRDVHTSHYGRLCPIQTPEGQNIGLILRLASYARVNAYGMIETPYVKVKNGKITGEIFFLNAFEEENYNIAHSATDYDVKTGKILEENVEVRNNGKPKLVSSDKVDYMDVGANQIFSPATSMIPFVNHDDANRALMGSNMQKQATPCIVPEAPLVATGIEERVARDGGRLIVAEEAGEITYVDSRKIKVKNNAGKDKEYKLVNFSRNNIFSIFHHRPSVDLGQKVKKGDVLADVTSSDQGQTAIGQNCLVAFMSWSGSNYEDAIILSNRLVKDSKFTSIHVEEFSEEVRDTKLGPEVTTHDIPNVSEGKLKNLDEEGIIRVGAEVGPGDILVGKITPKGETQLTPEERLLRSIFGEKARDVKDTSLRMPGGKKGRVISVKIFSREKGEINESGVIKKIYIEVAELRNISVGDKLAGRHGNKGVISRILPVEDMPHMADGTPVDVILTPLGVPSRMNLGQILELHLGLAAKALNYQAIVPPFMGATGDEIKQELRKAGFSEDGKMALFDGRTGEKFDQDIAVGYMYILKLHHMVEDKIHMRSVGPYSLINQQPLGGKAQGGGQRFGEMEVWALLGHGAAYTLREVLTIKSDDIVGRSAAFDAIIKGKKIPEPNIPASFNVLLNNLRGLALDVELRKEENN
ncbi:DNA-directed RNA polymerase subunit beta [Candidatus Campbellbacteria bacterium RIFCSPLOWO2_02_FULL_35_11]|uniref:DNA-directed RNA polymerase subunit beta n=2 Tax=Candidatus Campbelliibacteriota TaxID=1752727 RepID=A0A1F5ELC8_9BACT|nr:MAG: DNA-directed RNA polymerase subunit beta [Candidatus Campbellbacteria bacterium RIFCSPHIGHO2_12_FULL_35_10]OGD70398.1 MAG: DNA-directed RNA polymerase subunit beta [Candidatus Campbellbacteria bacterium RIFCSPLOWO2_02_FULL_35_11]